MGCLVLTEWASPTVNERYSSLRQTEKSRRVAPPLSDPFPTTHCSFSALLRRR